MTATVILWILSKAVLLLPDCLFHTMHPAPVEGRGKRYMVAFTLLPQMFTGAGISYFN